ncbi:DNA/RNA helicase domain-containing protein [Streptomyces varsoviensis]|uniref:Schlafen group 3-like DNA/RNA helicase domain-containing protein n=1 Tax=Streptomyces varsoviensis TaxID=67373 RepID=A0ABR5JET8_9ACTN|nr:DNA/RNA helicase domain-containing protein [Streptomyces varsoviensis]KOG91869.1 hypothetical protein ADK38_00810 [Streptomyces varsoviensis]
MHLFAGTVEQALECFDDGREFVAKCAERFAETQGRQPGEAELRSWRQSWPRLLEALSAAELHGLRLFLEYELPGTSQRVDALLLGGSAEGSDLVAVAIELKQWTHAAPHPEQSGKLTVGSREVLHPARQVGGYVTYFHDWLPDDLGIDVRGVALLHNAPTELIRNLRTSAGIGPSSAFPLLGKEDVAAAETPRALAERLRCQDLRPAAPQRIDDFLQARHRPSASLLSRVGSVVNGAETFRLIGDQDAARQEIHRAINAKRRGRPGHIVVVTGGPGTGKTVIASRVFADLCLGPDSNPRLCSPSGTLSQQLLRAVGDAGKGLISTLLTKIPGGLDKDDSVVLLDEAHRARTGLGMRSAEFPLLFKQFLENCAVFVLFLDEHQIVRPGEGTTTSELRKMASDHNCTFAHVDLRAQFRCSGSRAYLDWVDTLLDPAGQPTQWAGSGYDLAVCENPVELEEWVDGHIAAGESARITAGFCWPWESPDKPPLLPEVSIPWEAPDGQRQWKRPWNSRSDATLAGDGTPGRAFWATDEGGHKQIGCIYTAQGMEYDYSAVILGGDLTWTAEGWRAHPEKSEDSQLRGLDARRYLTYALNTYRVLLTRGTRGTRLYSTDADTQRFLRTLLPEHRTPLDGYPLPRKNVIRSRT